MQQIDSDVLFLAPQKLATTDWTKRATAYGQTWGVLSNFGEPIAFLTEIDELYVVSDEYRSGKGFDLKVGVELEDLMWRARQFGIKLHYACPSGGELSNPESCLERSGVPERIAEIDARRRAYTDQLGCLQIYAEYGSSGLWNKKGENIHLDFIALSFPLIKRIADWQRDYDVTLIPLLPETADESWWAKHDNEERSIVREIQKELGDKVELSLIHI